MQPYTIWIAAENWAPGQWNPEDDNSDAIVTFQDGSRWGATFFSYQNIGTLVERWKLSGECLSGKYFWASYPILVDEVSRARIEEVIADLLATRMFDSAFEHFRDSEPD
jgi:hypothetical protein